MAMKIKRTGVPLVISAPSGTGKSTLIARLHQEFPAFAFSVSCTTRPPRSGEINGKDYHFVDTNEFLRLRDQHFFAEWAKVHGNFYGTPLQVTKDLLNAGKDIIFDIDVQGARQIKKSLPQGCFVFVFPPSFATLQQRLYARDTETEAVISQRMDNAYQEIQQCDMFDFWIINDVLETAYEELSSIYQAAKNRAIQYPGFKNSLLKTWGR
jgi:guanylate kinase